MGEPVRAPKGNQYAAIGPEVIRRRYAANMVSEKNAARSEKAAERAEKAADRSERAAAKTRPIIVGGAPKYGGKDKRMFNETRQNEFLGYRREGRSISTALKAVGITMTELVRVRKLSPDFVEAEKLIDQERADALFERYIEAGERDPKLWEKALRILDPVRFGEKAQQVNVAVAGQVVHAHVDAAAGVDRILQLQATLAERLALNAGPSAGQSDQQDDTGVVDAEVVDD